MRLVSGPNPTAAKYQYIQLDGGFQRLDVTSRQDGHTVTKAYFDENGDEKLDGYKEVLDDQVTTFIEGRGARKYSADFTSGRTQAVTTKLQAASSAAADAKNSGEFRCVQFDNSKQVHFTGKDGTAYGLYAKAHKGGWKVTGIKVKAGDGSQPLMILPGEGKVLAPEAQQALGILDSLCQ